MKKAALLSLLAMLTGCPSTGGTKQDKPLPDDQNPDKVWVELNDRPTQHLELDPFESEWDEIDIGDDGARDAGQVARWVRQRRVAAKRCLDAHPPDPAQAVTLLIEILKHVPDSSVDRLRYAMVTFADAAYWFRRADVISFEIERLTVERTAEPNGPKLEDAQVEELIAQYTPYMEDANLKTRKRADESLAQWELYRKLRPDDRSPGDYIWKLYFYRQDYRASLTWLDYVLKEMDMAEVPATEPLRVAYEDIRKVIVEYLAKLRLEGKDAARGSRRQFPFAGQERAVLGGR